MILQDAENTYIVNTLRLSDGEIELWRDYVSGAYWLRTPNLGWIPAPRVWDENTVASALAWSYNIPHAYWKTCAEIESELTLKLLGGGHQ